MKQVNKTKPKFVIHDCIQKLFNHQKCCMEFVIWLILLLNILNSNCMVRSVSIDGAAYRDIVFEINNNVPVADCSDFLLNLEVNVTCL